jgi:heme/copper-type cytochrome/quinol oxidase subunit 4
MAKANSTHEDASRTHRVDTASNRSFGIVFSVVFVLISLWPLMNGDAVRYWAVAVATIFFVVALVIPKLLAPFNLVWTSFGAILHRVTNPIILGGLFFVVLVPSGLLMRLAGKDPLRLKMEPESESYWIPREQGAPNPDSMNNQF